MNNKRGFTLTEVLLAVMIVGLIGIALASLTRAASRESGLGRSRMVLRNNLSVFSRTLRRDLSQASAVKDINAAPYTASATVKLFEIEQNMKKDATPIDSNKARKKIVYCFKPCNSCTSGVKPDGASRGGKIYRKEVSAGTEAFSSPTCTGLGTQDLLIQNVKQIPSNSQNYFSPYVEWANPGMLYIQMVVELASTPIANDVIEETFTIPGASWEITI